MDISARIDDIARYICRNYGMHKNFLNDKKLYIHDNVFGTLKFTNFERKIVNSPFLQRLTKINQMGLTNLVYPGAVHNRFSHSLGVSFLAGKIYKEIMGSSNERTEIQKKEDINTIKLAGLLHDIGHGPFSHLTENVIKDLSHFEYPCKEIDQQIYSRSGELGNAKLHEFMTYHLLTSKPVKNMIKKIYNDVPLDEDLVALCITGNSFPKKDEEGHFSKKFEDKYKTFLIKIINGFSDSDKIDYLLRDSKFSGLPIPADIDRLISFLTRIEDKIQGRETYELGVSEKGTRAFNLLLQSRAKMFPTVYQHHTTLASETMLAFAIVEAIRNVESATKGLNKKKWPYIECGLDLLYYTDNRLLDYLRIIKNSISNDIVLRLQQRRFYRIIRKFLTWELKNKLVMKPDEYEEYLINNNKDLQELLENEEFSKFRVNFYLKYNEYEAGKEKLIKEFLFGLNEYKKMFDFKKELLSKEPKILYELKEKFPDINEDTLIDYTIAIRFPERRDTSEPYKQAYIKRYNQLKGEDELLSLREMGYAIPKVLDYQHITFYALPEYVALIKPHLDDYVRSKIPELYSD